MRQRKLYTHGLRKKTLALESLVVRTCYFSLQESADDDVVELVTTFKEERDAGALVPVFKEKVGLPSS